MLCLCLNRDPSFGGLFFFQCLSARDNQTAMIVIRYTLIGVVPSCHLLRSLHNLACMSRASGVHMANPKLILAVH